MIYAVGDTHIPFDIKKLNSKNFPEARYMTKSDYIIILGDFGLFWNHLLDKTEKYWLNWFNNIKKFTTLFIDGNHENHSRLFSGMVASEVVGNNEYKIEEKFGGYVGKISDSIYHLRRGEVYTIDDKKFFVMGGSYSIDKYNRVDGVSWWKEEEPNMTEINYALDNLEKHNNNVDYILGHTAPKSIILKCVDKYYRNNDSTARFFDHIIDIVQFKIFYCGHWHIDEHFEKYHFLFEKIELIE